jgi:molybdate transport system ATP-binding protein
VIEAALRLVRPGFTLDLRLALPARGVSALFGPSGCGKTTVLRALAGLERASGRVALGDEVWQDGDRFVPPHRRAIGYVIQESALFPHLSVADNLAYGLRRVPRPARRIRPEQIVELLGLGPLMDRRPATLSGGERQRVAIGRALATSPRLLLLDEPLAALDHRRKAELLPYLDRLHRELAVPMVYVSHSIDEVARLADHLVLLDAGRVAAEGPVPQMLARLDLSLPRGEAAGVVLETELRERDAPWGLVRLVASSGAFSLWARDPGLPLGQRVRVRVLARDVSLARAPQPASSIANQLQGVVEAIADDEHPALALVRVRLGGDAVTGGAALVAQLTRRSAHALALAPGQPVWVQVKTVALLE